NTTIILRGSFWLLTLNAYYFWDMSYKMGKSVNWEMKDAENCIESMNDDGILYILGEAGNEEMLNRAGIKRAKGIIAVIATDAENVFLILLAKQLNPEVFVVARASQDSSKNTLHAAGADKVISPL
nr:NAD-binding protein [Desulfobacula sp.]